MFSGIITEIGKVKSATRKSSVLKLELDCPKTTAAAEPGDSVSVNGVCLTVTHKKTTLIFDVVANTYTNTNLKRLSVGSKVNLENALKFGDDISGHFVSGHVDGERKIIKNCRMSSGWLLEISTDPGDSSYLISKGSVAIDGVSLTVSECTRNSFKIFLIPYTLKDTILSDKRPGDMVNVEYDMLSKISGKQDGRNGLTINELRKKGF